jgi:hypothetical protein
VAFYLKLHINIRGIHLLIFLLDSLGFLNLIGSTSATMVHIALAGFGPVALAPLTSKFFSGFSSVKPVKMSNFGNALHIGAGTLFCSVPVTYGCYLALKNV